jgi:FkbM family methyltransferase
MPYSQQGEEAVILEHLGHLPPGRCLDVGAYSPSVFSNTRALIDKGWSAMLVEPSPGPFLSLLEAYKTNPKVKLVNALVGFGTRWSMKKFWNSSDAVSTTEEKNYQIWKEHGQFSETYMAETPVREILALGGNQFDFISIDTEGTSVDILKAIDVRALGAQLVCVEFDDRLSEATQYFTEKQFDIVHNNGCNLIAKRA